MCLMSAGQRRFTQISDLYDVTACGKARSNSFSRSEQEFFCSVRDFKKNYLKPLLEKRLQGAGMSEWKGIWPLADEEAEQFRAKQHWCGESTICRFVEPQIGLGKFRTGEVDGYRSITDRHITHPVLQRIGIDLDDASN